MTPLRSVLGLLVAVVCALAIAALSHFPTRHASTDDALLRLSWRVLGVRVEECRPRTEEELAALAPHMRTPEVCNRGAADYTLRLDVDGQRIVDDTLRPGGARRDRPIFVLRDVPLEPGSHSVRVAFSALVPDGFDGGGATLDFAWEGAVAPGPAEISLITVDDDGTRLVHRTP